MKKVLFLKKQGDAKVIVEVALMVIAIALVITFRTSITGWLGELVAYVSGKVTALIGS